MKAILRRTKPTKALAKYLGTRSASTSTSHNVVVGIRQEDPERIWERRCPVTPDAVNDLVREGVGVLIQPCERRVWTDDEFVKAGATLHPTLAPANILVGIKETPLSELDRLISPVNGQERTHLMFSHTAKGQLYNMPLLSRFLDDQQPSSLQLPTLIDYELLTSKTTGKRVLGFGWYAGVNGVVEGLYASALDYLSLGASSPFLYLPRPFSHPTLEDMRHSLRSVGEIILAKGMPASTGPYIIGVTGNGNVSTGALDILKELPCIHITAQDLPSLVNNPDADLHKVYVVHVKPSDYIFKKDGSTFDRTDYYAKPEEYVSKFDEKIAPYISLLVNGAGWQHGFPRLLSTSQLSGAIARARAVGPGRFRTIADVSCDVGGGIEFLDRMTTIDNPSFYTNGHTASAIPGEGYVQLMSVDILPSELPLCASTHFSKVLKPYLGALVNQYRGTVQEDDAVALDILNRATIARGGELMPPHRWLSDLMKSNSHSTPSTISDALSSADTSLEERMDSEAQPSPVVGSENSSTAPKSESSSFAKQHRVLLLGSGMVAKPAVDELLKRSNVSLVIASNNLAEAENLTKGYFNAKAVHLDVADRESLNKLVQESDVVVSLLPAPFHPSVAELCISSQKHMVTASYISPAMREFDEKARSADVLLLNEIGLDPGIDHCSAMDMRSRIEAEGRKIVSFISWCGGLPAPENSDVPLGMKFSWSPKGLLSAALNDAHFKLGRKERRIAGEKLLSSNFDSVPLYKGFALEGLANRDSFPYAETYQLGQPEELYNLFRGTLRYSGFSHTLDIFRQIGLLSNSSHQIQLVPQDGGWASLVNSCLRSTLAARDNGDHSTLKTWDMLKALVGGDRAKYIWPVFEELGMVQSQAPTNSLDLPTLPNGPLSPLDLLTGLLSHKLRYKQGERDMVILSHEVVSVPKSYKATEGGKLDKSIAKTHTSTLVTYGTPSLANSAMSRTVGLPLAFATLKVLEGKVAERGVRGPCDTGKEVWGGVLEGLEQSGLGMVEKVVEGVSGSSWKD